MKKLLALFLSLALLLSLCACGNNSTTDSSKDEASSSQTEAVVYPPNTTKPPLTNLPSTVYPADAETEKAHFETFDSDPYSHQLVRYEVNKECKGYYATPKAKGTYPTVIIMHGQGTVEKFKTRLLSHINNWVKQGYLPPMVVVIPEVMYYTGTGESEMHDFELFINRNYENRFNALLTSIEKGTLSSKIDTSKKPYVAGFSMGGMAALHAGADYNTRIAKCGALSPGKSFYLGDGNWGFYNYASDIYFSDSSDARVYLSAGKAEQSGSFVNIIDRFDTAININNPDIVTKYKAQESWGGHAWALAQKEIFMFVLFATQNDRLPTEAWVETACNPISIKTPTVVTNPADEHK